MAKLWPGCGHGVDHRRPNTAPHPAATLINHCIGRQQTVSESSTSPLGTGPGLGIAVVVVSCAYVVGATGGAAGNRTRPRNRCELLKREI